MTSRTSKIMHQFGGVLLCVTALTAFLYTVAPWVTAHASPTNSLSPVEYITALLGLGLLTSALFGLIPAPAPLVSLSDGSTTEPRLRRRHLVIRLTGCLALALGASSGVVLFRGSFGGEISRCGNLWIALVAGGTLCALFGGWALSAREEREIRPSADSDGLALLAILAFIFFRFDFLFSGMFPQGLFWEEHETAYAGRNAAGGSCGALILYTFTEFFLGTSFRVFGISEFTVRLNAALVSSAAVLLFWRATRHLFSSWLALLATIAFITSYSLAMAGHISEESFSVTIFVASGLAWSFAGLLKVRRPRHWVGLGLFMGLACMEYAALKPALAIIPLGLAGWFICFSRDSVRTLRHGGVGSCIRSCIFTVILVAVPFLAISAPILANLAEGNDAFFEGARRAEMIGERSGEHFRNQIAKLPRSLATHLTQLFWSGAEYPPLARPPEGARPGLVSVSWTLLASAGLILLAYGVSRRESRRRMNGAKGILAQLYLGAFWLGWAAALIVYCSYFNPDPVMSRRLFVCVPLILLGVSHIWELASRSVSPRAARGVLALIFSLLIAENAMVYLHAQIHPRSRSDFRSSHVMLCEWLSKLRRGERVVVTFDWTDVGIFLGDTKWSTWAVDPERSGYESWACNAIPRLRAWGPERTGHPALREWLRFTKSGWLVLSSRAPERLVQDGSARDLLPIRVERKLSAVRKLVWARRCVRLRDSEWHLHLACPVRRTIRDGGRDRRR